MTSRLFEWHDLPALHRFRNQCLYLDTTTVLTRGPLPAPVGTLLAYFSPASAAYTVLSQDNGNAERILIGQALHAPGSTAARLSFLTPASAVQSGELSSVLDLLVAKTGERGAFHILAEVDESDAAFQALHQTGFAIYARQHIWQLPAAPAGDLEATPWRACTERDGWGVRTLYNNLVPGLVQQVEPAPTKRPPGMVYQNSDDLQVYVDMRAGAKGILLQPFIHPDADCVAARLAYLIHHLPNRRGRPVYLCVRSYQSWLEPMMEQLGAQPVLHQAVLVKHLTVGRRALQPSPITALEATRPEPTAPIARIESAATSGAANKKPRA